METERAAGLAVAAFVAGAVNSVAGGGTLLSFPAAVWAGLPPVVANASNTVALTPSSLVSAIAYRRELAEERPLVRSLLLPAVAGGAIGAGLLLATPQRVFEIVVPVLVLGATGLLTVQNLRRRKQAAIPKDGARNDPAASAAARSATPAARVLELLIGIYGGYFGAGIGILMLAVLDRLGPRDIHRSNAIKIVLAAAINGTAAIAFVVTGTADLVGTLVIATAASVGGFAGASLARRVDEIKVRWLVVAIGLVLSCLLGVRAAR